MVGLAGAAMAPRIAGATPTRPDIVVIGAGAAGIGAARRLMKAGRSVLVLEAADRIGGRAHTTQTPFGFPYDRGCAWLQGPSDLAHLALAREKGFGLFDYNASPEVLAIDGRRATTAERNAYWRAWATVERIVDRAVDTDVPVASLIPADLRFAAAVRAWLGPMDYGADLTDVSTADWHAYADLEIDYLVREGLGTLVAMLGADLPVRLSTPATHVDWSGAGVRVDTPDGQIEADACIVTVSTGVLGSGAIRFTPELPVTKQQAVSDVPMGLLERIGLQFDGERFGLPNNGILTNLYEGEMPQPACNFITFPHGQDIAIGFVGGSFGWELSRAGAAAAIDFATEAFVKAVGSDARKHLVAADHSGWATNPLTQGAYAAARPGRFAARAVLAEPLGERVFFAGEAVSPDHFALMSGAHMSGEAAADEVVAQLDAACSSCDARKQDLQRRVGDSE